MISLIQAKLHSKVLIETFDLKVQQLRKNDFLKKKILANIQSIL